MHVDRWFYQCKIFGKQNRQVDADWEFIKQWSHARSFLFLRPPREEYCSSSVGKVHLSKPSKNSSTLSLSTPLKSFYLCEQGSVKIFLMLVETQMRWTRQSLRRSWAVGVFIIQCITDGCRDAMPGCYADKGESSRKVKNPLLFLFLLAHSELRNDKWNL